MQESSRLLHVGIIYHLALFTTFDLLLPHPCPPSEATFDLPLPHPCPPSEGSMM